jgi:hypothetical protein
MGHYKTVFVERFVADEMEKSVQTHVRTQKKKK